MRDSLAGLREREGEGDVLVHGDGFAVEESWAIAAGAQRRFRGGDEKRRAIEDRNSGDTPVRGDGGVKAHGSLDAPAQGLRGIVGIDALIQTAHLQRPHPWVVRVPSHTNRDVGRGADGDSRR